MILATQLPANRRCMALAASPRAVSFCGIFPSQHALCRSEAFDARRPRNPAREEFNLTLS
jgi:hypothetical protein